MAKWRLVTFLSSLYFYHQIITLYFQARGLNYVQINSLWGIIAASRAIAEVPTGMLADRLGRKLSIVLALVCQLLGEILFLVAETYWLFVIVYVIAGMGLLIGALADISLSWAFLCMGSVILIGVLGCRIDETHVATDAS